MTPREAAELFAEAIRPHRAHVNVYPDMRANDGTPMAGVAWGDPKEREGVAFTGEPSEVDLELAVNETLA